VKPRMRQLRSGNWCCWTKSTFGPRYVGRTAWETYWEWLKNQRYVVVKTVGETHHVLQVDVHEGLPEGVTEAYFDLSAPTLHRALVHA
jgi:hypothetical protein